MRVAFAVVLLLSVLPAGNEVAWAGGVTPPLELSAVLGGKPERPVVSGTRVYVPSGRVITTWSHADPANPVLLATTKQPTSGRIVALARLGGYLYAGWTHADDNSGVAVYSLANPERPVLVDEIDDYAEGIKILQNLVAANGYLYLFDSEQGIFYGSVASPEQPVFTHAENAPLFYDSAVAHGDYIYARFVNWSSQAGFSVFDVSDPEQPTGVSGVGGFIGPQLFDIDVAPPLVAGFGYELNLFDASDPADVTTRGQIATPPATLGALVGDHAWSFGFDGLDVWDISDLDNPVAAGHADIDLLGASAVARVGERPLVVTRTDRIVSLDASDPSRPDVAGTAMLPGGAETKDIAILDEVAIVLQEGYGFSIVDADTLEPLGRFDADLPPQLNMRAFEDFYVDGDRVYLAAWGYGVLIVDISDVMNPVEVGRYSYGAAGEITARGDFVYVAKSTNGGELQVIDVRDPSQPVARGRIEVNTPRRVQVSGDHVYLADVLLGGLRIINISDPDAPVQVGLYDQDCEYLGNTAHDVVLNEAGTVAYVACHTGMHIVDVSDPGRPGLIGAYLREPDVYSRNPRVAVRGDRAWYADASGVHEIDISEPAEPTGVAVTPLAYDAPYRLHAAEDGRLFAVTRQHGIHVFSPPPVVDAIFSDRFEPGDPPPPPPEPVVSDYDGEEEGFLGASWTDQGVHYHSVNGVDGVFPNGDTFTADDNGDQLIIEQATLLFNDFPEFGSAPNVLTFGTSFVPGDNLTLGAMSRVRMDLDQPAGDATFEMVYYENGPWGGIDFNLEAYDGDTLVARDSFTIVGDDPDGRDNIAFSSLSVEAPSFDSLYLYATYQGDFSAPRLMIDDLTITPVAKP